MSQVRQAPQAMQPGQSLYGQPQQSQPMTPQEFMQAYQYQQQIFQQQQLQAMAAGPWWPTLGPQNAHMINHLPSQAWENQGAYHTQSAQPTSQASQGNGRYQTQEEEYHDWSHPSSHRWDRRASKAGRAEYDDDWRSGWHRGQAEAQDTTLKLQGATSASEIRKCFMLRLKEWCCATQRGRRRKAALGGHGEAKRKAREL